MMLVSAGKDMFQENCTRQNSYFKLSSCTSKKKRKKVLYTNKQQLSLVLTLVLTSAHFVGFL